MLNSPKLFIKIESSLLNEVNDCMNPYLEMFFDTIWTAFMHAKLAHTALFKNILFCGKEAIWKLVTALEICIKAPK